MDTKTAQAKAEKAAAAAKARGEQEAADKAAAEAKARAEQEAADKAAAEAKAKAEQEAADKAAAEANAKAAKGKTGPLCISEVRFAGRTYGPKEHLPADFPADEIPGLRARGFIE